MTTEQTAQQLELAAQILRTGHPWGSRRIAGSRYKYNTPIEVVADGNLLIPLLATPTDNRPIHNPDGLTADQVGIGYRLFLTSEKPNTHVKLQEKWKVDEWVPSGVIYADPLTPESNTYRLPLSVPWPEPEESDPYAELKAAPTRVKSYTGGKWHVTSEGTKEIKPNPAFQLSDQAQLPPPPPGMQWHRTDGWKDGDLPQGYRPFVADEFPMKGDECIAKQLESEWRPSTNWKDGSKAGESCHYRTTRPLTFEHAGKTWTWHRPGDPMPCDGERRVECVLADHGLWTDGDLCGRDVFWTFTGGRSDIIGWRYAELQTKTVPLGPEDVPPGSVFRGAGEAKDPDDRGWCLITSCSRTGIRYWRQADCDPEPIRWLTLKTTGAQINRSLPLTGKWNPDAWEPCHKKYDC